MMNIIVDVHGRHNKIASQLLSDERIFAAMWE